MGDTKAMLEKQNAFYETIREELEAESFGKWAVVSNESLVGVFNSNREASEVALRLIPEQVCLVKHIGYVLSVVQLMSQVRRVPVRNP